MLNWKQKGFPSTLMPSVITDACVKDNKCIKVCQRKNIHPREDEADYPNVKQLFINPKRCLACGSCISVCEHKAIYPLDELPEDKKHFAEINAAYFRKPKSGAAKSSAFPKPAESPA